MTSQLTLGIQGLGPVAPHAAAVTSQHWLCPWLQALSVHLSTLTLLILTSNLPSHFNADTEAAKTRDTSSERKILH